jgi:hypothetical protein
MTRFALAASLVICGAWTASAQTMLPALSSIETAAACAPPATFDAVPYDALRVIGSQDPMPRSLFGNRDLLVIGGGTSSGVQLGQQYFIRRASHFGTADRDRGIRTLGWLRVIAVNDTNAIAVVDHACGGIVSSDYLAAFTPPVVPAGADRDTATGEPDFSTLGHILIGDEDRSALGMGDFVLIDWGSKQGLTAGARFSIYRDVGINGMPLSNVGEGVVIAIGAATAQARITRTRDAVFSGDYIALRK